ncbi:MAG: hypothetical protein DSY92_00425 [Planctomycetota bacterium]|nr:MAG: hypothetical protein DSY92_00425 [Planctomycetota bacterium]
MSLMVSSPSDIAAGREASICTLWVEGMAANPSLADRERSPSLQDHRIAVSQGLSPRWLIHWRGHPFRSLRIADPFQSIFSCLSPAASPRIGSRRG